MGRRKRKQRSEDAVAMVKPKIEEPKRMRWCPTCRECGGRLKHNKTETEEISDNFPAFMGVKTIQRTTYYECVDCGRRTNDIYNRRSVL